MIVALARKLVTALWRFVSTGETLDLRYFISRRLQVGRVVIPYRFDEANISVNSDWQAASRVWHRAASARSTDRKWGPEP